MWIKVWKGVAAEGVNEREISCLNLGCLLFKELVVSRLKNKGLTSSVMSRVLFRFRQILSTRVGIHEPL